MQVIWWRGKNTCSFVYPRSCPPTDNDGQIALGEDTMSHKLHKIKKFHDNKKEWEYCIFWIKWINTVHKATINLLQVISKGKQRDHAFWFPIQNKCQRHYGLFTYRHNCRIWSSGTPVVVGISCRWNSTWVWLWHRWLRSLSFAGEAVIWGRCQN